jgi:alpha-1,6-mannosyltransferase
MTQFYSERSGGIKTYLEAKGEYGVKTGIWRQLLIVPYKRTEVIETPGRKVYKVHGVPVPWNRQYRLILDPIVCLRILRKEAPDVIEVGSPDLLPWSALYYAKTRGIPCVGFYHSDFSDTYFQASPQGSRVAWFAKWPHRVAIKYTRALYNRFDATLVATKSLLEKISQLGVSNAVLLNLGVDTELFCPEKRNPQLIQALGLDPTLLTVLYVGRLSKDKGFPLFLETQRVLWKKNNTNCLIAGDGPMSAQALELQREFPQRVRFLGYLPKQMLAVLYASVDIFIMPSRYETFGLAALEALSSGTPVIFQKNLGFLSEEMPLGGFLVSEPTPEALAQKTMEVLKAGRERLSLLARKFVIEKYHWDRTFQSLKALYVTLRDKKNSAYSS